MLIRMSGQRCMIRLHIYLHKIIAKTDKTKGKTKNRTCLNGDILKMVSSIKTCDMSKVSKCFTKKNTELAHHH